jgi:hypothetical protein
MQLQQVHGIIICFPGTKIRNNGTETEDRPAAGRLLYPHRKVEL